jgi:hypothetical protein
MSNNSAIAKPKLIYMPEESTPTIATEGNRTAVAYLEIGEDTDYYGKLFSEAEETAAERDGLRKIVAASATVIEQAMDELDEIDPVYTMLCRQLLAIEGVVSKSGAPDNAPSEQQGCEEKPRLPR